jgi:hypothetical protein
VSYLNIKPLDHQIFTTLIYFSQLPLENWADLLPFLPSKHLVALLLHFGDRQFASILQFCLNKLGIFIGCLRIVPPSEKDAMLKVWPGYEIGWSKQMVRMMLPDGPMPKNVKDFKSINLRWVFWLNI